MTDDFREELSEEDLDRLTGGGPAAARFRAVSRALWEYFEGGLPIGDAKTLGFVVVVELETPEADRAIRYTMSTGDGNILPSWTARGYLHDMLGELENIAPNAIQRPTKE